MAWRIVKQPNGLLARFSDVVDNFTHVNMTEQEAFRVCHGCLGVDDAKKKVLAGVEDWKPWTYGIKGDGLERWEASISTIRNVHGEKVLQDMLDEIECDAGVSD